MAMPHPPSEGNVHSRDWFFFQNFKKGFFFQLNLAFRTNYRPNLLSQYMTSELFYWGVDQIPLYGSRFYQSGKIWNFIPPPHLSHPVHVTASNGFERSLRMRYHKTSQSDTMVNLMNLFFYAKKLYKYHNNMTMKSTKPAHI